MGHLLGLKEYLDASYERSIFDQVMESHEPWEFHLHGTRIVKATIVENLTYDLKVDIAGQGKEDLPKIQVKLLYQPGLSESVKELVKIDDEVKALGLQPILAPRERYFVKNKTLFPLMKDGQVVFFTLLEGEIIRGIIADFSRYEITVNLKGGVPVVILRHSIYNVQNKEGRCLLKSFQDQHRDWQKSNLYVAEAEARTKPAKGNRSTKRTHLSHRSINGIRFLLRRLLTRRPRSAARGISTGVTSRRTRGRGRGH